MEQSKKEKRLVTEVFVEGAKKGWNMGINSIIPNVLMAYVLIKAMNLSGLIDIIGTVFAPVMGIFGLPGEAIAVLLGSFMSMGGGIGVAVSMFSDGLITGEHISKMIPAMFLMGALLQYAGRILGTSEVDARKFPVLFGIAIINAILSLFVMNIIV
ncbi:MAG: YjiG family protein [Tissierellia bacterium]|nr:YjiG family protein [Tissierellia bacterium]